MNNTSREVLFEAIEQALRPLQDSILKEYCKIYDIDKSEIPKKINLYNLVGFALTVIEETEEIYKLNL